jgi:hypothetical protein
MTSCDTPIGVIAPKSISFAGPCSPQYTLRGEMSR